MDADGKSGDGAEFKLGTGIFKEKILQPVMHLMMKKNLRWNGFCLEQIIQSKKNAER